MYNRLAASPATSWNQVEGEFLAAMSLFDGGLPSVLEGADADKNRQSKELSAAIQNGKGDWFNNVIADCWRRARESTGSTSGDVFPA